MCLLCVEFSKGKMTRKELRRNIEELKGVAESSEQVQQLNHLKDLLRQEELLDAELSNYHYYSDKL